MQIIVQCEMPPFARERLLPIDLLMDGESRLPRIRCEDLCRPARRSQQHHLLLQLDQRLHEGTHQRSLTRTCIPLQDQRPFLCRLQIKNRQAI